MAVSLSEIEHQARQLGAEERARLVESLLESLHASHADIQAAWAEEIDRRVTAFDRGDMAAYAAEDVFAEGHVRSR